MADVTLTAELRANIDNLERNVGTAVRTVTTGAQQIDVAAGRASTALRGVNPASNSAAFALTNLGRVAQDAPFGFIGIQNNLNPLLESFQRLRQEAGSNVGALRALASSLTGAAGLGIALSLITSALTLYTQYQQRAAKETKEAKKANDEYITSASKDVTSLAALYGASQNVNISLSERKAAVDELQKTYPAYFKNLSDEEILAGKATTAYNELTQAILNQAVFKAAQARVADISKPLIDLIVQQKTAQVAFEKANSDAFKTGKRQRDNPNLNLIVDENGELQNLNRYKDDLTKKVGEARDVLQAIVQDLGINSLLDPNKGFGKGSTPKQGFAIIEEQISKLKTALEAAVINNQPNVIDNLSVSLTTAQAKLDLLKKTYDNSLLFGKGAPDLPSARGVGITPISIGESEFTKQNSTTEAIDKTTAAIRANREEKDKSLKQQKEYNEELAKEAAIGRDVMTVFGQGLTDAFQSALQGTQSFISAIGQFLVGLVTRLLAAAAAAAILAALLSLTSFGSNIASGLGGFTGIFGQLSGLGSLTKLAEGGITNGPTMALIGEGREREVVAPLSKFDAMVSNRAANGGGQKLEPLLIGGDLLLKWVDRAQKSQSRRG